MAYVVVPWWLITLSREYGTHQGIIHVNSKGTIQGLNGKVREVSTTFLTTVKGGQFARGLKDLGADPVSKTSQYR